MRIALSGFLIVTCLIIGLRSVAAQGPIITKHPVSAEVAAGGTATLSVEATGSGSLEYQWRFNGSRIIGATGAELILTLFAVADEGDYAVDVADSVGTVRSDIARLTLYRDSDGDGLSDSYERGIGRYEIIEGGFTWSAAKVDAETRGGHLVTITSEGEWTLIKELFGSKLTGNDFRAGGTDEIEEGKWRWVSGEPWAFENWNQGEPNNVGNEDTLIMTIFPNSPWNDAPASWAEPPYILERGFYSDMNNPDTDGDGLSDGEEVNIYKSFPNFTDSDMDGLSDAAEIRLHETDPLQADSDGDDISDGEEITGFGTNPKLRDSDGDGLSDRSELFETLTNPNKTDTDGDGFSDSVELYAGKNPLSATDTPAALLNVYYALEIEFFPKAGERYQIQVSTDLKAWTNIDEPILGTGDIYRKLYSVRGSDRLFHRVEKIAQ